MFLAKVTGTVVATHKVASMVGQKLLIVEPVRIDPDDRDRLVGTGRSFVTIDLVGAGEGQIVLIVQGSSARQAEETTKLPIDTAIIGIVNHVSAFGEEIFSSDAS